MRRALALAAALIALAGCGGLEDDATCAEWLEASPDAQGEFIEARTGGRRVRIGEVRSLATGTCRFAVRTRSHRVDADAAVRNAVRTLAPAPAEF